MFEIIPSILTNNKNELYQMLDRVDMVPPNTQGFRRRVHIDIIDGKFANNLTVTPSDVGSVDFSLKDLNIDYHLMVVDPIGSLSECANADRVIAQVESIKDQFEFVEMSQEYGFGIGLALDLNTPVNLIEREIIKDLDVILVMGVKAGFGGQEFNKEALFTIEKLSKIKQSDSTPFRISVDGGVNETNIAKIINAGADEVVIGRMLFEGDIIKNIRKLNE